METHHHQNTEKKKWNHYIWEFLMLFLAVFAGFIAENLRENFTERKRENKYIASLIDDLKKDTTLIDQVSRISLKLARGQDSLIDLLNDVRDTAGISQKAYHYYFAYTTRFVEVDFSQRTISQLLNAGNMRLIEKQGVSDSIMDYNLTTHYVEEQGKAYDEYFKKTLESSSSIFDFTYARINLDNNFNATPKMAMFSPKLLTADPSALKSYAIKLSLLKTILQGYVVTLVGAKQEAVALLRILNRNYH